MVKTIDINKIYHGYKPSLERFYKKYFKHDGNPLLWKNTPICQFAIDYVKMGDKVLDEQFLDKHFFIRYEYERYSSAESVRNDKHKYKAANRLIKLIESIRKHGYAQGKFNDKRHLIRVEKGFVSPYGSDPEGYKLLARKHKMSACFALGLQEIKAQVHE